MHGIQVSSVLFNMFCIPTFAPRACHYDEELLAWCWQESENVFVASGKKNKFQKQFIKWHNCDLQYTNSSNDGQQTNYCKKRKKMFDSTAGATDLLALPVN